MKRIVFRCCLFGCALAVWVFPAPAQDFSEPPPPSTAMRLSPDLVDVIKMTQAGVPEEQINGVIKTHPRLYSLTSEDTKSLKKLGVDSKYISAMRAHDKALLRIWKRGAAAAGGEPEALNKAIPPKMRGGNPATDLGQPMREDAPLILLRAPRASTNPPSTKFVRPWTSTVIVEQMPPPPKLEVGPVSPGPDYVWIPGHWIWRGGAWLWESGRWQHRPSPGSVWMDGYWQPHARGWIWIPGEWR